MGGVFDRVGNFLEGAANTATNITHDVVHVVESSAQDVGGAIQTGLQKVEEVAHTVTDLAGKAVDTGLNILTQPSKGTMCYAYTAVSGCTIRFTVPTLDAEQKDAQKFASYHLEVDSRNLPLGNTIGHLECEVWRNGNLIFRRGVDISVQHGAPTGGDMVALDQQRTQVVGDIFISYGFYGAPPKENALKISPLNQVYISICPNFSTWMSEIAPYGSSMASKPFTRFVLPGAHDVGMNSMENTRKLLQKASPIVFSLMSSAMGVNIPNLAKAVPNSGGDTNFAEEKVLYAIESLSRTQKDDLPIMLGMGVRYFEFRPAHLHKDIGDTGALDDELYFTHLFVPGMRFDAFLTDCVRFLSTFTNEIIVCQIRSDGVMDDCKFPSNDVVLQYVERAISETGLKDSEKLKIGTTEDMLTKTIDQLRGDRKRLIISYKEKQYNIYGDEANATVDGDNIIKLYQTITAEKQKEQKLTVVQCQATATNIKPGVFEMLPFATPWNSILPSTKAICGSKTLPWIRDNGDRFILERPTVLLDDFVDGALCDVAKQLSSSRLNK